ncbi:MAG: zinc ribbon domain-containing protein [Lentisphaerae bacterium]|nr:MAG: zinc ribbon domain-containing protein [Lentisphaerota bacterium]
MPTYEYRCTECGHEFEAFQSMTAEPLAECPQCKGRLKRLIGTGAGIIFKGSGFYETDYKKKNTPPSGSTSSQSKQTSSDSAKSDTSKGTASSSGTSSDAS